MTTQKISELLQQGEGITTEFKLAQNGIPDNLYETICAFLNRCGGHILLGVDDHKNPVGLNSEKAHNYLQQIVTTANNPQKLSPGFFLMPQVVEYKHKTLLYIYVPESSQVHLNGGKIYDRNFEGDLDITKNNMAVAALYQRKQLTFTENHIFPYMELADLRTDLFPRIRTMANNHRANHPWQQLSDFELMKSAGLYLRDFTTGTEGFTLAAALLLGKDATIQSVAPAYKTDAILRVRNLNRFDDRDDIRTNLVEAYDRLMAFIEKHLPDGFYQESDAKRRSLRSVIFHEVIVNLLGHREFINPYPAKLIIEHNTVKTENWCKPNGYGLLNPATFTPRTKNPTIAKFFREIGRFEELGSGVRNIFTYTPFYSGGKQPELAEGDVFKISIPIPSLLQTENTVQEMIVPTFQRTKLSQSLQSVFELIKQNPGIMAKEISVLLDDRSIFTLNKQLKTLFDENLIERKGGKKNGGYFPIE